jgi:hypothetical protein
MSYDSKPYDPEASERDFRRWLSQRLEVDQPLEPGNALYVPLYKDDRADPVDLIYQNIDLTEVESLNFISGFRGSGKTTELFRLKKKLEGEGYIVAYANALNYLLPTEPVEISDFLLVLAGSFSEAIEETLKVDLKSEGFWTRFVHYLQKTSITLDGLDLKANVPGTDVALNFKTSLKEVPSFRHQLRQKLATRLGEVRREVHEFFEFGRKAVQKQKKTSHNVVFIFDQLEQLRDPIGTEGRVADSVTTLMANHRSDLKIPLFHVVFTVPPWLKFKLPQLSDIRMLYNVKLWKNDERRTRQAPGWKIMREVVEHRFTPDGMKRFFGPPARGGTYRAADKLIEASGGHFRDLILLLRESVLRVTELPITSAVIDAVINNLRMSYRPSNLVDAQLLHQIGLQRDCMLKDLTPETLQRITFFLDTHCALILRNGEEWYDVHPLIRDEVEEILQRDAAMRQRDGTAK